MLSELILSVDVCLKKIKIKNSKRVEGEGRDEEDLFWRTHIKSVECKIKNPLLK